MYLHPSTTPSSIKSRHQGTAHTTEHTYTECTINTQFGGIRQLIDDWGIVVHIVSWQCITVTHNTSHQHITGISCHNTHRISITHHLSTAHYVRHMVTQYITCIALTYYTHCINVLHTLHPHSTLYTLHRTTTKIVQQHALLQHITLPYYTHNTFYTLQRNTNTLHTLLQHKLLHHNTLHQHITHITLAQYIHCINTAYYTYCITTQHITHIVSYNTLHYKDYYDTTWW